MLKALRVLTLLLPALALPVRAADPARSDTFDPTGIIHLGDGAWGVNLRKPNSQNPRSYIARSDAIRHLCVVTLYAKGRYIRAVNEGGQIFDEMYPRAPNPPRLK